KVKISNIIAFKTDGVNRNIGIVKRILVINLQIDICQSVAGNIHKRRGKIELKISFISIDFSFDLCFFTDFYLRGKKVYNFIIDNKIKIYILVFFQFDRGIIDRKSTRLNSSHVK